MTYKLSKEHSFKHCETCGILMEGVWPDAYGQPPRRDCYNCDPLGAVGHDSEAQ